MAFARLVLIASGVAFLLIGVPALVAPDAVVARVGISLAGSLADNDARAVYGGVQTGLGAFLVWGGLRIALVEAALLVQQLTFLGLVGARLLSWALVGLPAPLGLLLHAAEAIGLLAGWIARRRLARPAVRLPRPR